MILYLYKYRNGSGKNCPGSGPDPAPSLSISIEYPTQFFHILEDLFVLILNIFEKGKFKMRNERSKGKRADRLFTVHKIRSDFKKCLRFEELSGECSEHNSDKWVQFKCEELRLYNEPELHKSRCSELRYALGQVSRTSILMTKYLRLSVFIILIHMNEFEL